MTRFVTRPTTHYLLVLHAVTPKVSELATAEALHLVRAILGNSCNLTQFEHSCSQLGMALFQTDDQLQIRGLLLETFSFSFSMKDDYLFERMHIAPFQWRSNDWRGIFTPRR